MRKLILNILTFFRDFFKENTPLWKFFQFWIDKIEIVIYLVVGALTTVVGIGSKLLFNLLVFNNTTQPTVLQNAVLSTVNWVAGVAFAYPTNRAWVFESKDPHILPEMTKFVSSRVSTWGIDWLLNVLLVSVFGLTTNVSTIIAAVIVVILNYVFSKLFVFKGREGEKGADA